MFIILFLTKSTGVKMEFLLDTANIEEIKKYIEIYPITGVTSNPSILKTEGKIDLFSHMQKIRSIIGSERTLHIQVIAKDHAGMMLDAEKILKHVDKDVYIKVPTTEEGLKVMKELKKDNINVTATAIYNRIQGFMAIACGVDYIAPYFNRMENLDEDSTSIIADFRQIIDRNNAVTKILAASFKNVAQVNNALIAGAHSMTLQPATLHAGFGSYMVEKAVDDFYNDWKNVQGKGSI